MAGKPKKVEFKAIIHVPDLEACKRNYIEFYLKIAKAYIRKMNFTQAETQEYINAKIKALENK